MPTYGQNQNYTEGREYGEAVEGAWGDISEAATYHGAGEWTLPAGYDAVGPVNDDWIIRNADASVVWHVWTEE